MLVSAQDVIFDVDAIVFDKDGTLIDVDVTWFGVGESWIESIARGDPACTEALQRILGVGPTGLVPGGVLATGTLHEIQQATRSAVAPVARRRIKSATAAALEVARNAPIRAIGDVAGAMQRLYEAGLVLAVASSDDLDMIDRHLAQLGVRQFVAGIASGDGPFQAKPHPDSLHHLSRITGTATDRMLMIGDSMTDLGVARNAGVAGMVAVVPEGSISTIIDQSDSWVRSIEDITLVRH